MTYEELREAVARAMREAWRKNGDLIAETCEWEDIEAEEREDWMLAADAALRVVREAMREPTRRMLTEGDTALNAATFLVGNKVDPMREAWRAMLAASPLGGGDE